MCTPYIQTSLSFSSTPTLPPHFKFRATNGLEISNPQQVKSLQRAAEMSGKISPVLLFRRHVWRYEHLAETMILRVTRLAQKENSRYTFEEGDGDIR